MKIQPLRRAAFGALLLLAQAALLSGQVIVTQLQHQSPAVGGNATFTVGTSGAQVSYQWKHNDANLPSNPFQTLALTNVQPAHTGLYTVAVTSGNTTATSSAILGVTTTSKIVGTAQEVASNITLPATGNTYDQVLLQGASAAITADPGQITRISYVDLSDDIVQVEFSGAGTLSLVLDNATGPAAATFYNQAGVSYMRGHARITISGANETTNVSVFTVGSITAVNQALFKGGVTYDGVADLASIFISSANGKFGGVRTANASYFASSGVTGIYAPGVQFVGPVFVGDINAFDAAVPMLVLGSSIDTRITGGDLLQSNAQAVTVSGLTQLVFSDGTSSHGVLAPATPIKGSLVQNGITVTSQIAVLAPPLVSILATKAFTDESGATNGEFTFTRSGSLTNELVVSYAVSGSATNGLDYPPLLGLVTIPAGASSAKVTLQPFPDTVTEVTEQVTLTVVASPGYSIGTAAATVAIADSQSTLYLATLRPATGATASSASGLATIVLSASETVAAVSVSYSNLSSGQAGAHLFLGNSTSAGDYVLNLPLGQIEKSTWNITGTGTYSAADIVTAIKSGLIYVGLDTAQYPAGELRGSFLSAIGSQNFSAPVAAPPIALTNITATDAARLLLQGTFGPKQSEIDALTGGSVNAWIDAQMALPNSGHRARTNTQKDYAPNTSNPTVPYNYHRQAAWFYIALQGPDQLRQRVAFALSQILVESDAANGGQQYTEGHANYYDLLANGAFGNFRDLLEKVTLNPMMGLYLSSLRNAKADPVTGTNPDENYAREVMQLFSIGLVQLQPDGTLKLDSQGFPIPTYNQATITETAKVFTGWAYASTLANPSFTRSTPNYIDAMRLYPAFHENAAKTIVGGTVLPANQGGDLDLQQTIDALFNHPNTGPFISRQLIQRLVTDNPSPAYVYRVAQKFFDNGFGVRGDLGAVVRAILTDYEARSPSVTNNPGYGKLREPLLRFTGLLRSFGASSPSGHYTQFANPENSLAQAALRAPSVFNFFEPDYVLPGPLAAAGLVAPEFQITTDTTAISVPNYLRQYIFATNNSQAPNTTTLNLSAEQALAGNVTGLLDRLNLLMAGGQLSPESRTRITTALNALPTSASTLERAQTAVLLMATSPDGAVQK